MIDIIKQTPYEYSSQSRDFQVLARLYTAIFNMTKMYIDNLSVWNNGIDNKLVSLRSTTLNFEQKHQWDDDDLEAVTLCFKYLIARKGTTKVLEYCINILMKVENLISVSIDQPVVINNNNITIRVPENLLTIGVLEDLVRYLLPIGLTYNIVKYKVTNWGKGKFHTELFYKDENIGYFNWYYNNRMTISDNEVGEEEPVTDWTVIEDTDKAWLGLLDGQLTYIPKKPAGIDHTTGITMYDEDGNEIVLNDQLNEVSIDVASSKKSKEPSYIHDTFVYTEAQFEGEKY